MVLSLWICYALGKGEMIYMLLVKGGWTMFWRLIKKILIEILVNIAVELAVAVLL